MMNTTLEKLNEITSKEKSSWKEEAIERRRDRSWTNRSAKIAVRILREIRRQKSENGMSQKMLAEKMDVSPQYINKLVKGKENLTLETISKIEDVLGIVLLEVPTTGNSHIITMEIVANKFAINRQGITPINNFQFDYSKKTHINASGTYG